MQNDLISRVRLRTEVDWLLKEKMISPKTMAILHRLIDEQPTAYDVEKVERQLYAEAFCYEDLDGEGYYLELGKALWIVSNGGKE